ncbi:beta-ketoacyl synthase chain length factor [Polaromonas sp. LjRoot131]|uniref:beta-ketoacyl synthase chain length factor n=1 Tax=Polaromonas sp. LjRoot131 TaxID=3342262 RepID=UPI003ED05A95
MRFEFIILEWSAYADGLTRHDDWLRWAKGFPQLPRPLVETVPALAEMPAMMRRRVDRLGRLACQVAYWCQSPAGAPMVFASRYGDATRSLALLGDLVQGQPLSPAGFGLSVHNAVSALYSIAQGHTDNTVVVAGGRASVAAALTEAAALLADGAPEVLVVYYEAPLPDGYAEFEDEPACEYAWAWRVARPGTSGQNASPALSLELCGDEADGIADPGTAGWPAGLAVLRHLLQSIALRDITAPAPLLRHDRAGTSWRWSAHA